MKAGVAKVKVKFKNKDYPLQGYGSINHISKGQENDLHARAFIFEKDKTVIALLHLECYFISHHLKAHVIEGFQKAFPAVGLHCENVVFCANSTHSAPGGYAHYPLFNITTKGFQPEVFNAYAAACLESLTKAWLDMEDSFLILNASYFNDDDDVAFNRSLQAFNLNKDMEAQDDEHTHLAVNRLVRQVQICRKAKDVKGLLNWFGVQGISIPVSASKIHPDNKGYAASLLENDKTEGKDFIAGFCVEAAGDSSPNYHGSSKRWPRGRYEDPYKSAYFNGFLQFEKARTMMEDESLQISLDDDIDFVHSFVDFSKVICDEEFTHNSETQTTAEAIAGIGFIEGNDIDSPGIDSFTSVFLQNIIKFKRFLSGLRLFNSKRKRARLRRLEDAHAPKDLFLELQEKAILGVHDLSKISLPYLPSDITNEFKRQYKARALREHTWTPVILPIQITRLGNLVILSVPGEITTAAGIRLRKGIVDLLAPIGVIDVVITSYANEYGGCITTFEEYQLQLFEGASTLFGKNTLAAFQTEFAKLAKELMKPEKERQVLLRAKPPIFSQTELELRTAIYK